VNTTVILLNTVLFKGTWELRAADYHDIQDGRNPYEEEQDKQHTFRVLKQKERNLFCFSLKHNRKRNCNKVTDNIRCEDSRKYPPVAGHGSYDKTR